MRNTIVIPSGLALLLALTGTSIAQESAGEVFRMQLVAPPIVFERAMVPVDEDDENEEDPPEAGTNDPDIHLVFTRIEFDTPIACPPSIPGDNGEQFRSREVGVYSDGSEVPGNWGAWDQLACFKVVVSTTTESNTIACTTGYSGTRTRTRPVTHYSDGSSTAGVWSAYDVSACIRDPYQVEQRQNSVACTGNQYGTQTYQRRYATVYPNRTITYSVWNTQHTNACTTVTGGSVVNWLQNEYDLACGTGKIGYRWRMRNVKTSKDGVVETAAWGAWDTRYCVTY